MRKGAFNHDPAAQFTARKLRSEKSASERVLWSYLRKERTGYSFRTQVRVANFYLDFYCAKAKLCIEVDGEQHRRSAAYDARRDEALRGLGIETMRIPSLDLFEEGADMLDYWVRRIREVCERRAAEFAWNPTDARPGTASSEGLRTISTPLPPSSKTNHFEGGGR